MRAATTALINLAAVADMVWADRCRPICMLMDRYRYRTDKNEKFLLSKTFRVQNTSRDAIALDLLGYQELFITRMHVHT
jgi:hypothetical protein